MGNTINHPTHYETGEFECIDVMLETQGKKVVQGFCIGNAFKYLYRHNRKNGTEDIEKARWYLNKYLELEEKDGESICNSPLDVQFTAICKGEYEEVMK